MKTLGTMFSGGELFGVGAHAAGYKSIWGIEKDDKIAAVARLNGFPVITGDVTTFDLTQLDRPDHLHASPPCPNFSPAKTGAEETELDIQMAEAVCRALVHFKPATFTMEQVVGYRHSKSFKKIGDTLTSLGYWWDATNLNSADFGVPQTRIRLWVRACRGLLRGYPEPVKRKGWYEAIEDLIPSLPDSEFAPWQVARLPEEYKTFMIGNGTYSSPRDEYVPADTITGNVNQKHLRAFIMQAQGENGKGYREEEEPMNTVVAGHGEGKYKAFVVPGGNANRFSVRDADEPARTVESANRVGNNPRAFVLDGQSNLNGTTVTIRDGEDPIFTVSSSGEKRPARAYVGRVVKLDIRCLGRFQTVPDDYKGLTVKINGNGVPCLLAQKVLETLE